LALRWVSFWVEKAGCDNSPQTLSLAFLVDFSSAIQLKIAKVDLSGSKEMCNLFHKCLNCFFEICFYIHQLVYLSKQLVLSTILSWGTLALTVQSVEMKMMTVGILSKIIYSPICYVIHAQLKVSWHKLWRPAVWDHGVNVLQNAPKMPPQKNCQGCSIGKHNHYTLTRNQFIFSLVIILLFICKVVLHARLCGGDQK